MDGIIKQNESANRRKEQDFLLAVQSRDEILKECEELKSKIMSLEKQHLKQVGNCCYDIPFILAVYYFIRESTFIYYDKP